MNEIDQAHQTLEDLSVIRTQRSAPSAFSPAQEIENNLMGLLKFRIDRIKEDAGFEDELKQAMRDRLPEATFQELMNALAMIKDDANQSVQKVLSPFIAKSDRVPLLDSDKAKERMGSDEQVAKDAPKDVLQGLGELSKFLASIGKASSEAEEKKPDVKP